MLVGMSLRVFFRFHQNPLALKLIQAFWLVLLREQVAVVPRGLLPSSSFGGQQPDGFLSSLPSVSAVKLEGSVVIGGRAHR
jgi:hypothetical protein